MNDYHADCAGKAKDTMTINFLPFKNTITPVKRTCTYQT